MKLQVRDICISAPRWKPACYVITQVTPDEPGKPYTAINLVNRKLYRLTEDSLIKIGQADPSLDLCSLHRVARPVPQVPAEDTDEYQLGRMRAEYCAAANHDGMRPQWSQWHHATEPG